MNHSLVNITSTQQEKQYQYGLRAYQGAIDWTNDDRFAVIPPGVNLEIFDQDSRMDGEDQVTAAIEDKLARDIQNNRRTLPCIIASSRLDPKKNHLSLVQAFAYNPALREIANLVILTGNLDDPLNTIEGARDSEKEVLESLLQVVDQEDLRGQVSMFSIRGQAQLGAAYRYFGRNKSVFALTALHEPFGLAPIEAMAAGLPVVVTKNGGPSETMQEGKEEFGVLIDPQNTDEISTALLDLFSKPSLWEKYAQAGYQRVISKYNWQTTAASYLEALNRTDSSRPREDLLQIHPFFLDPTPANDITQAELEKIYLQEK